MNRLVYVRKYGVLMPLFCYHSANYKLTKVTMHYVCLGECNGVADNPGTCQAEACSQHHQDLVACDCTDGEHAQISQSAEPQPAD